MPKKLYSKVEIKKDQILLTDRGSNLFQDTKHSLRQNEDYFEPVTPIKKRWYQMCYQCGVYRKIRAPLSSTSKCGVCGGEMDSIDYEPDHPSAREIR